MTFSFRRPHARRVLAAAFVAVSAGQVAAQASGGLSQAIANSVSGDPVLAQFYAARDYQPLWFDGRAGDRRVSALIDALEEAGDHGLPTAQYNVAALANAARNARTTAQRASTEAQLSRTFAAYARDVQSGVVTPGRVAQGIHRDAPLRGQVPTLEAFARSSPGPFITQLPPQTAEYERLMAEKARLEQLAGGAGWGSPVPGGAMQQGESSQRVAILRNRLNALGYRAGGGSTYDQGLVQAVATFQRDHGLTADGVAGQATLEQVNMQPEDRLRQVYAAMERERWMNYPLGQRHVWVNIPDYSMTLMENGRPAFSTRAVVGQNLSTHQTPEFSDIMEFMVINPSWYVPQSITGREYLPMLKQNRNAVSHLQLLDQSGNPVSRSSVNFSNYSADSFPYRLKEPPSQGNALGQVKFMFPNRHNIYLHDTPQKQLFGRTERAYSHGCVRLQEPFEFAYRLLESQTSNPQAFFQQELSTGSESYVTLDDPVRVHLVYRTAFTGEDGAVDYRPDIYDRDAAVFQALTRAGVSLRAVQG